MVRKMAAHRLSSENIKTLQGFLGDITEDDCKILIEEYGSNNADVTEIAQAIFDVVDTSSFQSVSDLIWNIKQNPCFSVRRSQSLRERHASADDSWCLARSKSSNTINKPGLLPNAVQQQRPASATAQIDTQPAAAVQAMPYSGTTNPIQILKTPKRVDITTLRLYMSNYLQDAESRNLLYDVYEQKSPKLLILMRGASGSGKSTLASIMYVISEQGEICSADNYFTKRNGEYVFNKNALGEAHEHCRIACQAALQKGDSPIIIDNTNTRVDEMLPYVRLAVAYNYDIKIVEPKTEWKNKPLQLSRKTVHGVPKRTIQCQLERFEKTTVKTMVERVLKQQGLPMGRYRPIQNMEWGGGGGGGEASNVTRWVAPVDPAPPPPPPCKPIPVASMPAAAVPSPPPPFTSVAPKPIQGFLPVGTSTSTKLTITPSTQSWIEPPSVTSPTAIMLSDLVPDLKNGVSNSGGPKPKRSGKRNGNSNGGTASTTNSSSQIDKITPVPVVFEDPAHIAFENLCKHFPVVPRDELEKFFNDHEGDADACVLALIEEGFEFVDSCDVPTAAQIISTPSVLNEDPPAAGQEPSPTIDWDNLMSIRNYMSVPNTFDGGSQVNSNQAITSIVANDDAGRVPFGVFIDSDSESDSSEDTEDESDGFDIELPVPFGRMLLRAFGHPDDELRELTQDELTIKLGADTAFEIYKALYINMHNADNDTPPRSNSTDETGSNSPSETQEEVEDEFDSIAISLSQMELETMSNDPQLASIMNIESKLNSQTEKRLQFYTAPFRNMAQNINFSRLKEEYPRLDEAIIDEIYCQCRLSMEMTRAALNELYPSSQQPSQNSAAQQQSSAQAVSNDSSNYMMYNPNYIKAYSAEEIRNMQRKYESLEKQWMSEMTKMKEYYKNCQSRGENQIKSYYIAEAKKVQDSMKALAEEMQYYKAITQNAKHNNDQILDLHGLKIAGAMRVLKEFLRVKEEEFVSAGTPKMFLLVITGQGKHSKNGCPVLQPAVRNYLAQKNYRFFPSKPGCFQIILTRSTINQKR